MNDCKQYDHINLAHNPQKCAFSDIYCDDKSKLDHICSQIPVFWRLLNSICVFEESNFLPKDVATIVLKMIHIRNETFKVQRYKEDFIEYKEPGVFLNT